MFKVTLYCLVWIVLWPGVQVNCISEQNAVYKLWLSFHLSAKLSMICVVCWWKLRFLNVVGVKTIIMQSPTYLWSWNASLCRNFTYICTCILLNSSKYMALLVMPLLLMFCICFWERTHFFQTSVYTVNLILVWNPMIWKVLLSFHYSGLTITIIICVNKIHSSIFLKCKCERHFTNIFFIVRDNHTENKHVTVALACCTTLALNSVMLMIKLLCIGPFCFI